MLYREQLTKQSIRKAVAYVSTRSQEQEQVQIIRIRGDKKGGSDTLQLTLYSIPVYTLDCTAYTKHCTASTV